MTFMDVVEIIGIKLSVATAGLSGGILRALSRKSFTIREMIASPICGALAASYMTSPAVSYLREIHWPLPDDVAATEHATAFFIGVSAMWIADLVLEAITRWVRGGPGTPTGV